MVSESGGKRKDKKNLHTYLSSDSNPKLSPAHIPDNATKQIDAAMYRMQVVVDRVAALSPPTIWISYVYYYYHDYEGVLLK